MKKISEMEVFISVADNNSFIRAAEKLKKSPSSVTKTISHMEARVGVKLFARNTRFITLTEAGKLYLSTAKYIITTLKDTEEEVLQLKGEIRGDLRILSPVAFSNAFLADACSSFQRENPAVKLLVTLSDTPVNINESGYDLSLINGNNDDVVARTFGRNLFYLCCSPEYLQRVKLPFTPDNFEQHDWMSFISPGNTLRHISVKKNGRTIKLPFPKNIKMESNNYDFLLNQAVNGVGPLIIPQWCAPRFFNEGKLVKVMEDYVISPEPYGPYLVATYPRHRRSTRKITLFLDHLEAHLKNNGLS